MFKPGTMYKITPDFSKGAKVTTFIVNNNIVDEEGFRRAHIKIYKKEIVGMYIKTLDAGQPLFLLPSSRREEGDKSFYICKAGHPEYMIFKELT